MPATDLLSVFVQYNRAIYPLQVALLLVAAALVLLVVRSGPTRVRFVWAGLALLWAWCGAVFFITFMAPTMPVAFVFGAAFLLQAALFAVAAWTEAGRTVELKGDARGLTGAALIAYALMVYPLIATALGQHFPAQPTFGAPCPLTIFSFGLMVMVAGRTPIHLLVIPVLWTLMAYVPVFRWGIYEDIMLPVAGVVGVALILTRNARVARVEPADGVGETPAPMEGSHRLH